MNLEEKVKQNLILRGFTKEQLLNNRGLIGAAIDEAALEVVKNINYDTVLAPVADENRKEVLICENCKTFWIAPMDRCDCGSTTLTRTHGGNYKLARNCG